MPLPASGPISLSQVNVELGRPATQAISLNESAVRALFGRASGAISMSDGYGKSNEFLFSIASPLNNADLRTLAVNAGWNGTSRVVATVNPGVVISSSSTSASALTVAGAFPQGVELRNNGVIVGMGGNGGNGGAGGTPGVNRSAGPAGPGGPALLVQVALSINNAGTIAGGGGGGGGATGDTAPGITASTRRGGGGGGGGRSSLTNSSGGAGGPSPANAGGAGGAGTYPAAGAGGPGVGKAFNPGYEPAYTQPFRGGAGGNWGAQGVLANEGVPTTAPRSSGPVGAAGGAVSGNPQITWIATGTRLGPIT